MFQLSILWRQIEHQNSKMNKKKNEKNSNQQKARTLTTAKPIVSDFLENENERVQKT